jgi:hypothetical protein
MALSVAGEKIGTVFSLAWRAFISNLSAPNKSNIFKVAEGLMNCSPYRRYSGRLLSNKLSILLG